MEQGSTPPAETQFEADVSIGKTWRFIDRNGSASIVGGELILRKRKGEVIVQCPLSEVRAEKSRFSGGGAAKILIGGERYTIEPLRVRQFAPTSLGADLSNLARSISRLQKGRELTQAFLRVVEAQGGHIE